MGPIGCPETSVTNHQCALGNIPQQSRSHLHCGGKLKSCIVFVILFGKFVTIAGAFAKLQKATVGFVMSVRLSFRPPASPHEKTRLPLD